MRKKANSELGRLTADEYGRMEKLPVVVVADNIRSLHNVGSLFRTCDAFGMEGIRLCGITAVPPNKEIHKTALGAEMSVPWQFFRQTTEALDELKAAGYTLLAVEQAEESVALGEFVAQRGEKYALVFGNEVDGVSQQAADRCDGAIEIPQIGTKHSLNVSVAAGVVLWELFRQLK
ncbi:MAG: RNA methyltransferase [Rikenellaceae bacterium]|jgi:tRNA G18 (ribose-2'-O)-methylase SpoU|nr:RNA methyltransferase [Rikenellaceae bacterium]